jgi:hypothetical protein
MIGGQDLAKITNEEVKRCYNMATAIVPGIIGSWITMGLGLYESAINGNHDTANFLCNVGVAGYVLLAGLFYSNTSKIKELKNNAYLESLRKADAMVDEINRKAGGMSTAIRNNLQGANN